MAIGENVDGYLDLARPSMALYIGGMGAPGKNFYNELAQRYGYEKAAKEVQQLYLAGKKAEAAEAIPLDFVRGANLVGPRSYVAERIAAFKEAGVTMLSVAPVGPDALSSFEAVREITADL